MGRWDGFKCHDIHIECHKNWFRDSKVDGGHSQTHRQYDDGTSLLLIFQNTESEGKNESEAKRIRGVAWNKLAQDKDQWHNLVDTVINLSGSIRFWELFLSRWATVSFSRRIHLHGGSYWHNSETSGLEITGQTPTTRFGDIRCFR
jgi:hypothetical protein